MKDRSEYVTSDYINYIYGDNYALKAIMAKLLVPWKEVKMSCLWLCKPEELYFSLIKKACLSSLVCFLNVNRNTFQMRERLPPVYKI